jgi:LDH2 family malate/lactate/ureidoglycolate dehydrogenase
MKVSVEQLRQTTYEATIKQGYDPDEANTIVEVLLYAQLRGNNQGVVKLIGAGMPKDPQAGTITIVRETKISALIDGAQRHGMVVMNRAVDLALEKVQTHDIALVGTRSTCTSTGSIGYYASRIAQAGYIGLVSSGTGMYVSMHGSYEPLLGTNPFAIGIPSTGKPIVFDMATSGIARFGVIEAKTAGRALPEGVAFDAEGRPTTDPAAALAGAIRPFGGYKGAALSVIVEVLTGPLVGASFVGFGDADRDWGNFVFALSPALLVDADTFRADVARMTERLKAAKRLEGVDAIMMPGERGDVIMQAALDSGSIEIEDNLWAALQKAAGG